jgi:hypothetical protein
MEFTAKAPSATSGAYVEVEFNEGVEKVQVNYPAFTYRFGPRKGTTSDNGCMRYLLAKYDPDPSKISFDREAVLGSYPIAPESVHNVRLEAYGNTFVYFAKESTETDYTYVGTYTLPANIPQLQETVYPRLKTTGGEFSVDDIKVWTLYDSYTEIFGDSLNAETLDSSKWTNYSANLVPSASGLVIPANSSLTVNKSISPYFIFDFTVTLGADNGDAFKLEFNEAPAYFADNYPAFTLSVKPRDAGNSTSIRYYSAKYLNKGEADQKIQFENEWVYGSYSAQVNTKHDIRVIGAGDSFWVFAKSSENPSYTLVNAVPRTIPADAPRMQAKVYPRFVSLGHTQVLENVRIYAATPILGFKGYEMYKTGVSGTDAPVSIGGLSEGAGEKVRFSPKGYFKDAPGGTFSIIAVLYEKGENGVLSVKEVKAAPASYGVLPFNSGAPMYAINTTANAALSLPADLNGVSAGLFVWDGLNGLKPLLAPHTFE